MDINEELLNRIFIGGIEEFKDNGMKFTMDSLAKRIGISKRTLYENISSKIKKLVWFEHSKHVLTLYNERDKVYETIKAFLKE